jgi:molecular chaperone DnaJ
MAKNYYIILGLTGDASDDDIRSAYRRLAKNFHPDHYGMDSAPFLQLQEAYNVLSDPLKRRKYDDSIKKVKRVAEPFRDVTAETLSRKHGDPFPSPIRDTSDAFLTRSFNTFTPSFNEIFDYLWNNFTGLHPRKSETIRPLTIDIPITPAQAQRGGQVRILVPAEAVCPSCNGIGRVAAWECWQCAGEGSINGEFPVIVDYVAGINDDHTTFISLDKLGIRNMYLTVRFRITEDVEWD